MVAILRFVDGMLLLLVVSVAVPAGLIGDLLVWCGECLQGFALWMLDNGGEVRSKIDKAREALGEGNVHE